MKELVGHYVAYRKLVSRSPSELLPEDQFGLYAVTARFPQNLSGQVPWNRLQAGVYDCQWGSDRIRVVVAGELPREAHNAPLHLFSASPNLVGFGSSAYRQRSEATSLLLRQLFERFQGEELTMSYTMEDFKRDYFKEHFPRLTPEERREVLESLPADERRQLLQSLPADEILTLLSADQIKQLRDQLSADRPAQPSRPRRKK
jgi:hypothetical protein